MQQFEPHDALFMFGFSRGAYTVRAVASLLHMYGLLPPGNEPLVPYAIRMMNAANKQKGGGAFKLAQDFRATFRGIVCRPHFVGVWDTVNSVGWVEDPLKLPYSANNPDIASDVMPLRSMNVGRFSALICGSPIRQQLTAVRKT